MGHLSFFEGKQLSKALLARTLFAIHGIITIWRVTDVNSEKIYYLLIIPVCLLPLEMILTLKFADSGEWKWFCPSVLLYLASVVPGLWLLQFDLYNKRIAYRDSMGWAACSADTVYNSSNISSNVGGVRVSLSDDSWALGLEQFLLTLLIVGRWLLPRGSLTRDQLSQLLLVHIGMAADILEFSLESLNEQAVMCNYLVVIIILGAWNWSLMQFTLVSTSVSAPRTKARAAKRRSVGSSFERCSANDILALFITIVMQDGPFLAMRLYLIIQYNVINQMMIFFLIKNALVVLLQVYRMTIVCCGDDGEDADPEDFIQGNRTSKNTNGNIYLIKKQAMKKNDSTRNGSLYININTPSSAGRIKRNNSRL